MKPYHYQSSSYTPVLPNYHSEPGRPQTHHWTSPTEYLPWMTQARAEQIVQAWPWVLVPALHHVVQRKSVCSSWENTASAFRDLCSLKKKKKDLIEIEQISHKILLASGPSAGQYPSCTRVVCVVAAHLGPQCVRDGHVWALWKMNALEGPLRWLL